MQEALRPKGIWLQAALYCLLCAGLAGAATYGDVENSVDTLETTTTQTVTDVTSKLAILRQANIGTCSLFVGTFMTVNAGDTIAYPIRFITGPKPVAALQADVMLSSGITVVSMSAGLAAIQAGKSVSFSGNPSNPVLLSGFNQTPIGDGEIIVATLKLATTLGPGLYPVVFTNPVASDPIGTTVPICVTSGVLEVL